MGPLVIAALLALVVLVLAFVARDAWIRALADRRDARQAIDARVQAVVVAHSARLEAAEKKLRELDAALGRGVQRR